MSKGSEIVVYVRKDHVNVSIIKRMGEASTLIPKHGFKYRVEDVTHDYVKQKELHQTPNAANEYPLFQYHKDKENIYHIGNLESLKAFLSSPPPSVLSLHDSEVEVQDIISLLSENSLVNNSPHNNNNEEKKEEQSEENVNKEEEEEKEPALGFISQSLQSVEGVVKYSTSWITSWFYSSPTVTPLTDTPSPSTSDPIPSNNADNNNNIGNANEVKNKNESGDHSQVDGNDDKEEIKDFKVVQTNWYWRQQNRVLRFDLKKKIIYRYDPLDLSIRAIHPFSTLKDITCYNSQYFYQLTFYKAENDPTLVYEYYTCSSSDYPLILSLLTNHSSISPNVQP